MATAKNVESRGRQAWAPTGICHLRLSDLGRVTRTSEPEFCICKMGAVVWPGRLPVRRKRHSSLPPSSTTPGPGAVRPL